MHKIERNDPCPCCSGLKFKKCCGPALAGEIWPQTAEALMRSRYTAFVAGHLDHLWRTSHPENEMVKGVDREKFDQETFAYCQVIEFEGLTVDRVWPEDENGVARVLYTTKFLLPTGVRRTNQELSQFVKLDGKWVYLNDESFDPKQL